MTETKTEALTFSTAHLSVPAKRIVTVYRKRLAKLDPSSENARDLAETVLRYKA